MFGPMTWIVIIGVTGLLLVGTAILTGCCNARVARQCPNCHQRDVRGAQYCGKCGTKLGA